MTNLIINFALAHQEFVYGAAAGYAIGHIPQMTLMVFHLAMKIPWLRAAIIKDPKKAKAIIDAIHDELDKDIDEEANSTQEPAAPTIVAPQK